MLAELTRIVEQIRAAWPQVRIIVRGDSGFCRNEIMRYCEHNGQLDYVLGLAKNSRLIKAIETEMAQAQQIHQSTQEPARVFKDFRYRTKKSWSCERRVVGKAEYLAKGTIPASSSPRLAARRKKRGSCTRIFTVPVGTWKTASKNSNWACLPTATSTSWLRSNQLRLYFSSFAYILVHALRRLGLRRNRVS